MMMLLILMNYYLVIMMEVERKIQVDHDHGMVSMIIEHDISMDCLPLKKVHLRLIDWDLRREYTMNDCC